MAREYPGVYAYEPKQGARCRYNFRDADGKPSCKRGFLSSQGAAIDKAGLSVRAAAATLHPSTPDSRTTLNPGWPATSRSSTRHLEGATAPMASSA